MKRIITFRYGVLLIAAACILLPSMDCLAYEFGVHEKDGYHYRIWWTDMMGNRMGDPLFDGDGTDSTWVKRSTTSPVVYDHSNEKTRISDGKTATYDAYHGLKKLIEILLDIIFATLFDVEAPFSNIYYVVDLDVWDNRPFTIGDNITFTNGVAEELPGYYVVEHPDPGLNIADIFDVDTLTGARTLNVASGATEFSGTLQIDDQVWVCGQCSCGIPTLTEWGLIILTLLMLVTMTYVFIKKKRLGKLAA